MKTLAHTLRREARVAFSLKAQPLWFRIFKWTFLLVSVALFCDRRWFWWTLACLLAAGLSLHFFYRWKTKTWTRTWGGWNDLAASRD